MDLFKDPWKAEPGEVPGIYPNEKTDYWPNECTDPNHNPGGFISIPAGHHYKHICPSCRRKTIIRGSNITC